MASAPKRYKNKVQCIGYSLDMTEPWAISEDEARRILETAIGGISKPVSEECSLIIGHQINPLSHKIS